MADRIEKFEDLSVWKEAMRVARDLFSLLEPCKLFGLRDQMQRSAVSVPSNIAEGFERRSNKEYIQHLFIAKGSCSELRTQLYLAVEIGVIDRETGEDLLEQTRKISAMLYNLIRTRQEKF